MRNTPTAWFPLSQPPAVPGVYRLRSTFDPRDEYQYSYWTGTYWGIVMLVADFAEKNQHIPSKCIPGKAYDAWRGVQEQPEWHKEDQHDPA